MKTLYIFSCVPGFTLRDMSLCSLFCLMLVVLHVEETVASTSFSILIPKEKILASPGDTLTLPCSFTPALRLEEVRWYRSDKYATPILLYKNLQIDEQVAADPHYSGRASLIGGLEEGNVSLKLENITMADTGEYVCYLQHGSWYEKGNVHVEVRVLGSVPLISVSDGGSGQVKVTCQSEGWSPKPTLTWRNAKGIEIKKGFHDADSIDDNSLMSVSSWMLVSLSDSHGLSCSVGVSGLGTRESRVALHLFIEQACISASTAWKDVFIAILALSLIGIGIFYLYKKGLIKWPLFQKTTESQDGTVEEKVKLGTEESMQHGACAASHTEERASEELHEVKADEPGLHSGKIAPEKPKVEHKETNTEVDVSQTPEWDQVKQQRENLSLKINTCPPSLEVKHKEKTVRCPHPEKIHGHENLFPHVLCEGPLKVGKYYWEVDMKNSADKQSWYVGVCSTEAATRKDRVPVIPENGFWVLQYEKGTGLFANTNPLFLVPTTKLLSRLGVYLDARKGFNTLSFYRVERDKRAENGWPLCSFKYFKQEGGLIPVLSPGLRDKYPLTIC